MYIKDQIVVWLIRIYIYLTVLVLRTFKVF